VSKLFQAIGRKFGRAGEAAEKFFGRRPSESARRSNHVDVDVDVDVGSAPMPQI
jgi:hypothetical protein